MGLGGACQGFSGARRRALGCLASWLGGTGANWAQDFDVGVLYSVHSCAGIMDVVAERAVGYIS